MLIQIVNNDIYYAARRNRIHSAPEPPPPAPCRRAPGFAALLLHGDEDNGDARPASPETPPEPDHDERGMKRSLSFSSMEEDVGSPSKTPPGARAPREFSDILSETSAATIRPLHRRCISLLRFTYEFVTDRLVNMLHLSLMWLPGMGTRAERWALLLREKDKDAHGVREFDLNHEPHTGALEDAQLRLHLFIDWCAWTLRSCIHYCLGDAASPSVDVGAAGAEGAEGAERGGGVQVRDSRHESMSLRHFRVHQPRRRALNFSATVQRVGYPFQQLFVRTVDGYRLELHRLPRPGSDKVMFLQHGIMDSSYSFVAKGASDGLAFRAFDKGFDVFMGNFRGTSSLKHASDDISARDYWDYTLDDHGNHDMDAFVSEIWRIKRRELSGKTRREAGRQGGLPTGGAAQGERRGGRARAHAGSTAGEKHMPDMDGGAGGDGGGGVEDDLPEALGTELDRGEMGGGEHVLGGDLGGAVGGDGDTARDAARGAEGEAETETDVADADGEERDFLDRCRGLSREEAGTAGRDVRGEGATWLRPPAGNSNQSSRGKAGRPGERGGESERKLREAGEGRRVHVDITLVAHSMGAAAALIYLVNKRRANAPHRIARAVLMSPAGYHHRIPRGCRVIGPWLDWMVKKTGVYSLSVPSETARNLSRKLMQDAVSVSASCVYLVVYAYLHTLTHARARTHTDTRTHRHAYRQAHNNSSNLSVYIR